MYKDYYRRIVPQCIPARLIICIMTFTACWTSYMVRLQMPILAVPMIKALPGNRSGGYCTYEEEDRPKRDLMWALDPGRYLEDHVLRERLDTYEEEMEARDRSSRSTFATEARPPDTPIQLFDGRPFDWSPEIRGQLIASYSYGNVPGNFIGGALAVTWGPRKAILWTSLLAALISLVSPFVAQIHWGFLLFTRIIIGVTGGVIFPACHTLVAKWAPPHERARFIWALLGGTFGTILTYPMVAGIAENINWECGWYIPSMLMLIWVVSWSLLAYDSPMEHPGISEAEREYILTSQAGTVKSTKPGWKLTPCRRIMTSVPFLSLILLHFGNLFLLFFYQNSMMLYLTKALGFKLTKGGFAASLPWAGRMVFGFFFSWMGDTIKSKQLVSVTILRKTATIFSHLIPAVFLVFVGYVGCSLLLANIFLVLALGFNGAASISNLSNNQDLAPNFAGFLYGIMNTFGCASGMIISPIVEEIAGKHGHPIDRWQIVFSIGAGVCILSMAVFVCCGSGRIQPWNEIPKDDQHEQGDPKT